MTKKSNKKPNKMTKQELMEQILRKRVAVMSKEEKLFYKNNETHLNMLHVSIELEAMSLMLDEINKPKKPKKS